MKRENHLDFMTNRKNKYSIRKFSVGAASILVGSMIFISPQVGADETTDDEVTEEEAVVEEEQGSTEEETVQNEEETNVEEEEAEEEAEEQVEEEEEETEEETEEEADDYESIEEAYLSFRMTGYAGEQPDIFGFTADGGTITVVLPNGEEYVFEPDETGNVDEVFPVALEDNTEITVIFTDSEGGTHSETLLYTSAPAEEDPEDEEDPEEEVPEEDEQPDDGEDDNSNDDGQEGDEGSDDDSEDGQDDSDDSDEGQDDDDAEDEETPDNEEPTLAESSYFSANLSGYEGDGYLTIDGSAPENTVVTLTMPDGSVEEVTVDESGSFSVEIDEYPVGSEVNVHFLFEDDSEFEDDLEIRYLGDEDEDDSEDGQDDDEGSDDSQGDDDSEDGQDDSDDSDEDQNGDGSDDGDTEDGDDDWDDSEGSDDDSEDLDEDEVTYSYLEDYGTGIMVHSNSAELLNLTLSVEVLSPSALIEEPHNLYDIEILDEDGNEYELNNPVTVSIPADGSVSNVYYLGENGETVESVPYSVEDGYVVFEASNFSQYAVAYNEGAKEGSKDDGTSPEGKYAGKDTSSENKYAGEDTEKGHAESDDKEEVVPAVDQGNGGTDEASGDKAEELPNTGVADNGLLYSIATLLGALGLGSLVFSRRRKN